MLRAIVRNYREAFAGLNRTVWLLCVATLVNRSGTMVLPFLVLYLTERLGFDTAEAGGVLGVYGLGALGGAFVGGWLSDRLDARRVMAGSLVLTAVGFLVLEHQESRVPLFATVFLLSLVGEAFRPANSAALAAAAEPENRPRSFALNRLAVNLGMTLGPAVGGFLAVIDYAWLFRVDAATCLIAAGLLWAFFRQEVRGFRTVRAQEGPSPWRDRPFVAFLALNFLLAAVTFQVFSTLPLSLRDLYAFSEPRIGLVLAVNTAFIVLFEMVLVHRLSRRNPLAVSGVGSFVFCVGLALLPLGSGFGFAAFTVLIWSVGEMMTFPLLGGWVASHAPDASRGRYMGLFTAAFSGAFVVAPFAGTWVYGHWGPRVLWYGIGAVGLLLWAGFQALAMAVDRRAGSTAASAPEPAAPG